MNQFGEYARWFGKRFIIGGIVTGLGLAAWNWKHSETAEEPPSPVSSAAAQAATAVPLPRSRPHLIPLDPDYDSFPRGIRDMSREDQAKQLHLPPNIFRRP